MTPWVTRVRLSVAYSPGKVMRPLAKWSLALGGHFSGLVKK